ncbi:hypothetical protein C8R43DRAFT_952850 [Mycena crocata]|nr:hypothetical protein C8R43DRAFT_952850 [Mycena crocata]
MTGYGFRQNSTASRVVQLRSNSFPCRFPRTVVSWQMDCTPEQWIGYPGGYPGGRLRPVSETGPIGVYVWLYLEEHKKQLHLYRTSTECLILPLTLVAGVPGILIEGKHRLDADVIEEHTLKCSKCKAKFHPKEAGAYNGHLGRCKGGKPRSHARGPIPGNLSPTVIGGIGKVRPHRGRSMAESSDIGPDPHYETNQNQISSFSPSYGGNYGFNPSQPFAGGRSVPTPNPGSAPAGGVEQLPLESPSLVINPLYPNFQPGAQYPASYGSQNPSPNYYDPNAAEDDNNTSGYGN